MLDTKVIETFAEITIDQKRPCRCIEEDSSKFFIFLSWCNQRQDDLLIDFSLIENTVNKIEVVSNVY